MIDAKSAQLLVTNKVKELQQAVQDAAAQNAALVNANLIDPEVSSREQVNGQLIAIACIAKAQSACAVLIAYLSMRHDALANVLQLQWCLCKGNSCIWFCAGDGSQHDHLDGLGGSRWSRRCHHARRARRGVRLSQALWT